MNTPMPNSKLLTAALALLVLVACTVSPTRPDGADAVRAKLTALQADPQLAGRAPHAMKEAEEAVETAEQPTDVYDLGQHRVVMADRKVDIARAEAQSQYAEDQRKGLSEQRMNARLDSRTREADNARNDARSARSDARDARGEANSAKADASIARSDADSARSDAATARGQADAARSDTALAQQQSAELQIQITALNARETDRGLVVTLGDVLFASGRSTLKGGSPANLSKLAFFLNKYPDRTVIIEGHTDSVGSVESNLALSQRRADAVKAYLVSQGVAETRLSAAGLGKGSPVADNDSATGRQQNRRVEVIISNTVASSQ